MPINYYLPTDEAGRIALMKHVAERLSAYLIIFGFTQAVIDALLADIAAYEYADRMVRKAHFNARLATTFRNELRDGRSSGSTTFPPDDVVDVPPPASVPMGVLPRFTTLIAHIKSSPNYTEAIGQDLGIIGTQRSIDPSSWQPVLDIRRDAGHPVLVWTKGDADSLEIWVARNPQDDFSLFDITTDPHYLDAAPLPAVPTTWRYKAIYRLHNGQVGSWSNVTTTLVGA